ncbi:MAG: hypothetical protein AAFU65_10165 [Pseudomonadota bacterium]
MADRRTFVVQQDCWFQGEYCREGDELELTDRQAKYAVIDGRLKPKPAGKSKAKAATSDA